MAKGSQMANPPWKQTKDEARLPVRERTKWALQVPVNLCCRRAAAAPRTSSRAGERWRRPAPRTSAGAWARARDEEVPLPVGLLSAVPTPCLPPCCARGKGPRRGGRRGGQRVAEDYRGRGCFGGLGRIVYRHCFDTPSTRIGVGHGVRHRHVTSAACRCNRDCSILECSRAAVVIYN